MVILFMVILVILWDSKLATFESPIMVMFRIWCFFSKYFVLGAFEGESNQQIDGQQKGSHAVQLRTKLKQISIVFSQNTSWLLAGDEGMKLYIVMMGIHSLIPY